MNIQQTNGRSVTEALPDMEGTRRQLIALRVKYGANTPAGHRCSNLIEQIQAFDKASSERLELAKLIDKSMAELARLTANQ